MNYHDGVKILHYDLARSQIRSGDILICSGNSFYSKLIRKATRSKWSHVAFILRLDVIGRIMVMESVESIGVRTVPLSCYLSDYNGSDKPYDGEMVIARHDDFDQNKVADLSRHAIDVLSHNYNKIEIARISMRILTKMFKRSCEIPSRRTSEYICSEYVYECYKSVGLTLPTSCGYVAPSDFANAGNIKKMFRIV